MKILIYYPKTQKTEIIECSIIEAGPGGLYWNNKGEKFGFVGFDSENYQVNILKD